jgi:hypothetical protein
MSRYIDATELSGYKFGLISPYAQKLFHQTINEAPTVKAIPISELEQIINNTSSIQEDVIRYKMICALVERYKNE